MTLITAEERLLAALGPGATDTVAGELGAANVETITGVELIDEPRRDPESPEPTNVVLVPEQPADLAASMVASRPILPACA